MLPRDFLKQMAIAHELTPEQEEVFLLRLATGKRYEEIAASLQTSPGACLKRMGQVYNKFNISGESRGKENRLRIWLTHQLQETIKPAAAGANSSPIVRVAPPVKALDALSSPNSEAENSAYTADDQTVPQVPSNHNELIGGMSSPDLTHAILQNLPSRDYTYFVGRQFEIARLLELLSFEHSAHLISVDGIGGVGKTTLVLEVAYRCLQASPDSNSATFPPFAAIIFTSAKQQYLTAFGLLPRLQQERTLRDIMRTIAYTLAHPEITHAPLNEQLMLIRSALADQKTLLIVDNLETIADQQEVVSFVYDLPPTVKVILTSREQALFSPIRLDRLPQVDGLALIDHEAREKGIFLNSTEAEQLYQATSGVPAAIVYTLGQFAAGYTWVDVLAKLKDAQGDVARFCFQSAIAPLKQQPSYFALMALAIFPQSARREALVKITLPTSDSIALREGLAQLQQRSLVKLQQDRYMMLPLTREYALAELAANSEFEHSLRERWLNYYLRFSEAYGEMNWKEWQPDSNDLAAEWSNLQAVMEWCIAKHRYEPARSLWHQVKGYAHLRGYWDDRLAWTDWFLETAKARNDWATLVRMAADRGWTLTLMGQPHNLTEAHTLLQQAWDLRDHQDPLCQLEISTSLVVLSIRQKQIKQAKHWLAVEKQLLEQAQLSEQERERQWIHIRYYEAEITFHAGKYAQAKKLYQQILEQAEMMGWHRATVAIQNWLADVALCQGNLQEAQRLLEQGLPAAEQYHDKRSIAFHQRSFAQLEQQRGNVSQAKHWASLAANSFESLRMTIEAQEVCELVKGLEQAN